MESLQTFICYVAFLGDCRVLSMLTMLALVSILALDPLLAVVATIPQRAIGKVFTMDSVQATVTVGAVQSSESIIHLYVLHQFVDSLSRLVPK